MTTDEQLFSVTDKGIRTPYGLLDFNEALEKLDEGYFDNPVIYGMNILCLMGEAEERGFTDNSKPEVLIKLSRWLYSAVAFFENEMKNGALEVPNDEGGVDYAARYIGKNGGITIYPRMLRLLTQENMEREFIEKFGPEEGINRSISVYRQLVGDPDRGEITGLTLHGWKMLEMIMDPIIDELNAGKEPEHPVIH